ncbi:BREX-1 system adenine-specific DNA-methyltransferase PglX [Corallococcus sp. CA041A]|uniref:BREX-1 system adenine-specific DNA-methyltransferase PglX n=1 Tax=Corallococcus sp. CA041A TaxID=2316727 RepID=UPI000EA24CE1|nr:BREX-1 system adenine-specific DNA-methyltransferase PglX [Corallococcus sp. CA041A]RKH26129.1 BREX-1 system adenine-specific DNA-methyltransferase PglX [Corallococcus sp. CA041A]
MDKDTRNAIERATQRARMLLEEDFAAQLEGGFDVHRDGKLAAKAGGHLSARQAFQRERIVAAIEHKRASGMSAADSVGDYLRDAAFTTINRFVALKMLEARELMQECITKGEQSAGYREFAGMAPGLPLLPDSAGYRLYIESLFDELSTEVKVLFDRRDPSSVLWPKRATFEQLLEVLNDGELAKVWGEDETIGWVYQYFNSLEERQAMKDVKSGGSQAPRNSRELATRNQFFTPRYIVRFLTDNTLGRLWWEMRGGLTALVEHCEFLTVKSGTVPPQRAGKDPRDIRVIDPACGSGHFLLYGFDLLIEIYREAWADPRDVTSFETGKSLREDYSTVESLNAALPELIVRHNLYGVDIDPRCVQVASFALWLRAQRAWRDFGVQRSARRRIERSNIILAEPMPGDDDLVREFARHVEHPLLAEVFEKIVGAFKLAGDLGLMLRVERTLEDTIRKAERATRQGEMFGGRLTSTALWDTAEEQLIAELTKFAAGAPGKEHERRRLFRHDSAHGLALLDAARMRFDVVLMNPPFGDTSGPSKEYVEGAYPDSRQDIFAVFVDRCVRELAPTGFVGVISTEAGLFRRTLEPWRRNVLLASSRMEVMAHLGGHVLDGATVRVAAYALASGSKTGSSLYLRLLGEGKTSREPSLRQVVGCVRSGTPSDRSFATDQREFEKLPYAVFGYWCSPELRDVFVNHPALEGASGRARQGLASADDFRFLRLRWEVAPSRVGADDAWMPFAKGGEYSPYFDDIHLLVSAPTPRSALAAFTGSYIRNPDCYGKRGITWPPRTNKRFAPRALPGGCAFGHKGPSIVGTEPDAWALLAALNSRVVSYLLSLGLGTAEAEGGAGANSYEVGLVQRIPVPRTVPADSELASYAKQAWTARADTGLRDETTAVFRSPIAPLSLKGSLQETWAALVTHQEAQLDTYVTAQEAIDRRTSDLYGLTSSDWTEIESNVGDVHRPEIARDERARREWAETIVAYLVGCAFGRWTASLLLQSSELSSSRAYEAPTAPELEVADAPAVLVDDAGHPLDVVARCEAAVESAIPKRGEGLLQELVDMLGVPELRRYLSAEFFASHLRNYTKSRRSAPYYVPLSTRSSEFIVWLNAQRVTGDTLFTIQSEFLAQRVRLEEGRVAATRAAGGGSKARRELEKQEASLEELHAFVDDVRRVAPLWKPNLDDGAAINFAPLWRLVPHHKAWQKELKATWDALCEGEYDWAHLAMHLWPERVVPKCVKDRSLAIAHGLEDVFWVEGTDAKWTARKTPTRSVEELVRERTSPAVKSALKSLLEAPTATGKTAGRGRGGHRKAAAAEGGDA